MSVSKPSASLGYGDYAVDREDDDPDPAVVVNHPPRTAEEWELNPGYTVADDNPDYPADAPVIIVVYLGDLEEYDPDWRDYPHENRPLAEFARNNVPYYAFPRPRMKPASQEVISKQVEPTPPAERLHDLLSKNMEVHYEDETTVVATKFGETYRISPGGPVEGEGVLRDRLEDLAQEHSPPTTSNS